MSVTTRVAHALAAARADGIVSSAFACVLLAAALGLFTEPARAGVQAIDDAGHTVTLAAPARRIVSLAPHLTELLFAAGAGAQVVGVDAWSDHPAAARSIARIGDSAQLDLERIVALKPDLIVVWHHGNSVRQLQRLATLGIPTYASEARKLADISSTLVRLGRLAGTDAAASVRAVRLDAEVAALRTRYAGRRAVRVFYQIWHRPLLTINGQHLINEALALCGATNVFAGLAPLTPQVSEEAVVQADPEAIVTGKVEPNGPDPLDTWRRLAGLRATRLGNLLVVDPDTLHRQSDRIVQGATELCVKLDAARARSTR